VALHHASSGELIDVRPLNDHLSTAITKTLYKSHHLEVFRMILCAGKSMPSHHVVGEVTIQCLEGDIELAVADRLQQMRAGDLVCLSGGEEHALTARKDSSVLVTLLLHGA
jgi:quercetin dioxygenase-like cupin family protein